MTQMKWFPISYYTKLTDDPEPILVLQGGRRFVAEWDDDSGHFFALYAIDGVEREKYYQEYPGRLYNVTHFTYLPKQEEHMT